MRYLILFACFALQCLTGCSQWDASTYSDDRMFDLTTNDIVRAPPVDLPPPIISIHCEEITNIINEVSVDFEHKKFLYIDNAKTFYNEEGIHTIQLQYHTQETLDPCEARELIVDLVDALMKKLNDNVYLVPEFSHLSFLPSNFEIYITFSSYVIRYIDPYYIKYICLEDGIVTYYAGDLDDNDKDCWHTRKESFKTSRELAISRRNAEAAYKKKHSIDLDLIFGNQRFVPQGSED